MGKWFKNGGWLCVFLKSHRISLSISDNCSIFEKGSSSGFELPKESHYGVTERARGC
jgi:hypothetical protein